MAKELPFKNVEEMERFFTSSENLETLIAVKQKMDFFSESAEGKKFLYSLTVFRLIFIFTY